MNMFQQFLDEQQTFVVSLCSIILSFYTQSYEILSTSNEIKNSLRYHEQNTKENHNHVVFISDKTRLLFSKFLTFENINFQTFFMNRHIKGFVS